jgi:hypothetical protein
LKVHLQKVCLCIAEPGCSQSIEEVMRRWGGVGQAEEVVPKKCRPSKRKRAASAAAAVGKNGDKEEGSGKRVVRWASSRHQQRAFTDAWLAFLGLPLPADLLKQVCQLLAGMDGRSGIPPSASEAVCRSPMRPRATLCGV